MPNFGATHSIMKSELDLGASQHSNAKLFKNEDTPQVRYILIL